MNDTAATLMSIAMLAAIALLVFGTRFALRPEHRKQGLLMIVAGLVLVANVLIWVV
jgi:hypothetical protein